MLLRYVGPTPDRSAHYQPGGGPPLQMGMAYDVAEILEDPGFLMVRRPGSTSWPTPGEPLFGIDPYLFEPTTTPIEILSCGYQRITYLSGKLGCILCNSTAIAALQRAKALLEEVNAPQAGESLDAWRTRTAPKLSEPLAKFVFSLGQGPLFEPETLIYEGVVAPKSLPCRFAVVLYDCADLVRWDITRTAAERRIVEFLDSVGVKGDRPELLDDVFWIGDGSPRLINVTSDHQDQLARLGLTSGSGGKANAASDDTNEPKP